MHTYYYYELDIIYYSFFYINYDFDMFFMRDNNYMINSCCHSCITCLM